ncbi:hypothetical protein [Methanocaldococcus jannaschii]|nr:hypothetical protein [Methanocaldococcus jannaschii]
MVEENNKEILIKLKKIRKMQRRRTLIGSFLVSTSIIISEISVFIFVGVFNIDISFGLLLLFISLIFLSLGLYLIMYPPPIVID